MWPWRSMMAGMTVLPARSTRTAPAGICKAPCRPTWVNWLFSTTKAEFSMGALPSPVMRRAPSKTVTAGARFSTLEEQLEAKRRHTRSVKRDSRLVRYISASCDRFVDSDTHQVVLHYVTGIEARGVMKKTTKAKTWIAVLMAGAVAIIGSASLGAQAFKVTK